MCQTAVLKGLKIGLRLGPEPPVFDFAPARFDLVNVGAVSGQVKEVRVLVFPRLGVGFEGGRVVETGVVEHQHREPGAGGGSGRERIYNKGGVERGFAGGGQVVGGGV